MVAVKVKVVFLEESRAPSRPTKFEGLASLSHPAIESRISSPFFMSWTGAICHVQKTTAYCQLLDCSIAHDFQCLYLAC